MSFDNNTTLSLFQFHKGTIKTLNETQGALNHAYFNSIKVRLKLKHYQAIYCSLQISIP